METVFKEKYEFGESIVAAFGLAFNLPYCSNDNSLVDSVRHNCDYYTVSPQMCGKFDTSTFKANDLCCICNYTDRIVNSFNETTEISEMAKVFTRERIQAIT